MGIVGHRPHLRHGSLLPPLLQTERLTHLMRETAETRAISNEMPVAGKRQTPVPVPVITGIVLASVPSFRITQSRTHVRGCSSPRLCLLLPGNLLGPGGA